MYYMMVFNTVGCQTGEDRPDADISEGFPENSESDETPSIENKDDESR